MNRTHNYTRLVSIHSNGYSYVVKCLMYVLYNNLLIYSIIKIQLPLYINKNTVTGYQVFFFVCFTFHVSRSTC
jgi:hypothetical protein